MILNLMDNTHKTLMNNSQHIKVTSCLTHGTILFDIVMTYSVPGTVEPAITAPDLGDPLPNTASKSLTDSELL